MTGGTPYSIDTKSSPNERKKKKRYLDLHLVEDLAVVDTDHASNHLGDDDDVPQMGLDNLRLL